MKKTIIPVFCAALLFAGCNKEGAGVVTENKVRIDASAECIVSKASVADNGSFAWQVADKIGVWCSSNAFKEFSLSTSSGSSASFEAALDEGETIGDYAFYPYNASTSLSGTTLSFMLPAEYTYSESDSNAPMAAVKNAAGSFAFNHLGAVIKVGYSGIPASASKLVLTAPIRTSGSFDVDLNGTIPAIVSSVSSSQNTVTITGLPAAQTAVFYVPVPTGDLTGMSVALYDANDALIEGSLKSLKPSTTLTAGRAELILLPTFSIKAPLAVSAPADEASVELDYDAPDTSVPVTWTAESGYTYSFVASLSESMAAPQTIPLGATGSCNLTHQQLEDLCTALGVQDYKTAEIHWRLDASNGSEVRHSGIRTMKLWRMLKPFTDPRDGESYRVMRVRDSSTDEYAIWLADNLRAVKYSDGTALNRLRDYYFVTSDPAATDEQKEWDRLKGGYYNWSAVVRDVEAAKAGNRVQGLAPALWHIPSRAEWQFLLAQYNGSALKDTRFWAGTSPNTNASGFNAIGTGFVTNLNFGTRILKEEGAQTYFWTSEIPQIGDTLIGSTNTVSTDPGSNKGYTIRLVGNDTGFANYYYAWTMGNVVRCVLD